MRAAASIFFLHLHRRTRSIQRIVSFLAGALLLACTEGGGQGGGNGGTVIVGMRSDFGGFNPVTSSGQYDIELMNYALFTPLVSYDESLAVRPFLAESWELQGDTGVVFHLRSDVRWHDGQPVTAHDVEFTFNLAKSSEAASPLLGPTLLANVASAQVVDERTIAFRFTSPHAQALEDFWWPPLPRHVLQNVGAAELRNAPFNRQPVGSGPFRVQEWRANEQLLLVRNPEFSQALGGPAATERVVFRIIPEASTMLTELLTGNIHVDIPLAPDQARQVESNADTRPYSFPGKTVYFLGWNNARPLFADARVRRALGLGINRQEIVDALLHGQGQIATSPIPPWHRLYPGVEPQPHDVQQATRLLEQAGWQDRNGDGVRENASGQRLTFTLLTSSDELRRGVVEVIQSQLRQVGADAQVQVMEFQTMLQNHKDRNFDAVLANWTLDNFQAAAAPMSLFHSKQADIPQSANRSSVKIPRLDAAMERAASTTDEAAARTAWREVTEILQEEQPVTFLFWLNELAAARRNVNGVEMDPRGEFMSIARWSASR
jgi:peptide/nickel transport system substrate-binding protein